MPRQAQPVDQALASVLAELRQAKGLTQEDVAYRARITVGSLARIEQGKSNPGWSTVSDIAKALNVPLTELAKQVEHRR